LLVGESQYGSATLKLECARDTAYFVRVHKETALSLVPNAAGRKDVLGCRLAAPAGHSPRRPVPPALDCLTAPASVAEKAQAYSTLGILVLDRLQSLPQP
jgi:hypothetical protein